jgi:hypothetical protein
MVRTEVRIMCEVIVDRPLSVVEVDVCSSRVTYGALLDVEAVFELAVVKVAVSDFVPGITRW